MINYKPQIQLLFIEDVTKFQPQYYYIGKQNDKYDLPKSVFYHYSYFDVKKTEKLRIENYKRFLFESYNKLNPFFYSDKKVNPSELWKYTNSILIRILLDEMTKLLTRNKKVYLLDSNPIKKSHGNCIKDALNYFANNQPKIVITKDC